MVQVHPSSFGCAQIQFTAIMTQFLQNINNATTGQKLQGMSIDDMIIPNYPKKKLRVLFKNLEYVVLSCNRTLKGLYLIEKLDENESFEPSDDSKKILVRARARMSKLINHRKEVTENRN